MTTERVAFVFSVNCIYVRDSQFSSNKIEKKNLKKLIFQVNAWKQYNYKKKRLIKKENILLIQNKVLINTTLAI